MKQANTDIRELIANSGVKHWEVALKYGVDASYFSRMLRHELDNNKKEIIKNIIKELTEETEEKKEMQSSNKRIKPEAIALCNKVMCLIGDKLILELDEKIKETIKKLEQTECNSSGFYSFGGYGMGLAKASDIVKNTISNTYASELLNEAISEIKESYKN